MDLRNKKKKLSIHVILNPCKASGDEIYSLAIRVLYCRKKKEYSLGRQVHGSNYRVDGERVVYSPEGILKRRDPGSINRLIMEEKEGIVKSFLFLERTGAGVWFGAFDAETSQGTARPVCGKVHFAIYRLFERGREAGNSRCLYERVAFSVAFCSPRKISSRMWTMFSLRTTCTICVREGLRRTLSTCTSAISGRFATRHASRGEGWQG